MIRGRFPTLLLIALLLAPACRQTGRSITVPQVVGEKGPWTNFDSWYRDYPGSIQEGFTLLNETLVHVVPEDSLVEATGMVRDLPFHALTPALAARLAGTALPELPDRTPYLLRGLLLEAGNGSFEIFESEQAVLTLFRCMGRKPVPMTRRPLVVQLRYTPHDLFVACSMEQ
jgi:hypothetical protein